MNAVVVRSWAVGSCRAGLVGCVGIVAVMFAASCLEPKALESLTPEECSVYSALCQQLPAGPGYALEDSTVKDVRPLSEDELARWDPTNGPTVALREANDDLRRRTGRRARLDRFAGLAADWPLVPSAEIDSMFGSGTEQWPEFHRRFPGVVGYTGFSRVGFSRDRRFALVWTGSGREFPGGGSLYWILAREGGGWKVRGTAGGQRF